MINPMTLLVLLILANCALYEVCRCLNNLHCRARGNRK